MATIWRYRCTHCGAKWSLLSKRYVIGPTQWNATEYSCFKCQTFLTVPAVVDASSWNVWYDNNIFIVERNSTLSELARRIVASVAGHSRYAPVPLQLDPVICPTCPDTMSTASFGERPMKCPDCLEYAGEHQFDGTIETI
jgi:DNA-directed RNA polymerase subunit RPC12/RpoP